VEVVPPGVLVNVQVPVAGKPFKTTFPVAEAHVGWVIVPIVGTAGNAGGALMTILAEGDDVPPTAFVTV
jgi:hypothetical protein